MNKVLEPTVADDPAPRAEQDEPAEPSHTREKCLNCEAKLTGPFCHRCGQNADDHHRSIGHLIWEAVEGFTHLDGRLANTLPALLFRPGRLARDHIEGRRMRHVPPLRMFLVSLLIFVFAAEWSVNRGEHNVSRNVQSAVTVTHSYQLGHTKVVVKKVSNVQQALQETQDERSPFLGWVRTHVGRAAQNHELFEMLVFEWAHRLAILMLPILAALLSLFYVNKRQFYIYDHLIVSMQYLSFCFLIWAIAWVMPNMNTSLWTLAAMIWTPVNLYLILRTTYGSSRIGAGIKTIALSVATAMTFALLLSGLLLFALSRV